MLITSDEAFGFGQQVTGGKPVDQTPENLINVSDKTQLKSELAKLTAASTSPTVLALAASNYEFKDETQRVFTIGAKNVTIRAQQGSRVELKNLALVLDLATIDNILIEDLALHSNGVKNHGTNDAILFDGTTSTAGVTNRVRITHCTFDGYPDMGVEIRSHLSRLLATIDHCHFVDRKPGKGKFHNRGSINVASVIDDNSVRLNGSSSVTVAFNFFEDIWRRSPRVSATGNRAHIFNNLLFRWGFGNETDPTWGGMLIENKAMAVIQANRFIPWARKASGEEARTNALKHDADTTVDVGDIGLVELGQQDFLNELDNAKGKPGDYFTSPLLPKGNFATIPVSSWYAGLQLTAPMVTQASAVPWATIISRAGTLVRDPRHPLNTGTF
jgi:pectate lyase